MGDTIYSITCRLGQDFFGSLRAASLALLAGSLLFMGCAGSAESTRVSVNPEISCDSSAECKALGDRARFGIGQPADALTALAYYEMACSPENADAAVCLIAGKLTASRECGEPDHARAEVYLRRACEVGSIQDCYDAGGVLSSFSPDSAMHLFGRACNAGLARGCTDLGVLTGLVLKDESQSLVLLQRGCTGGDPVACKILESRRPVASAE